MIILQTHSCSRCKACKPLSEFPPSKATNKGQWCRLCLRESARRRIGAVEREVTCAHCSTVFRSAFRKASYCSRGCKERARRDAEIADRLAVKAAQPSRSCLHCGGTIGPEMRTDAAYCGEPCNQAAHNATRKASWKVGDRQERVSRAYIIERDAGRCHLCGAHPAPGELHLDHVVPLARGGSHDAANLRVACARCNLSKRADSRGEQLSLVG